jgi:cell division protease FtsH
MQKVDAEIRRIIDEQYALARRLIEENRDKVEALAQALLEYETLDAEQIDDIMAGRPPRPPKDRGDMGASPRGGASGPASEPKPGAAPDSPEPVV